MIKKVLSFAVIGVSTVTLAIGLSPNTASAALGDQPEVFHSSYNPGKSTVTISTSNTEKKPVKASGYLSKYFKGYAHKAKNGKWQFHLDGYGDAEGLYNNVRNDQTVRVYLSEGKEQGAFDVKVKTIVKKNKVKKKKAIKISKAINGKNVKIKNNKSKSDVITIKKVSKNDKITIYNAKGKRLVQKTAKGNTIKIYVRQLGKKAGAVNVSTQKKGYKESGKIKVKYGRE
ncbi:hypothetical protein ACFVL4_13710 [Bacillus subtilis]|uniref:hypothetical protein n=1 Tax=Bacillus subtilis TaxID=1423 RepID=UPI00059DBAC1|nr:hypothetical protein [Bacillus subtilis]KIN41278.1 hypothetical protein B4071_4355 [Bacillus subtilis]MEC2297445.1 hypothetical protein [Bacillus subtilis]MEC3664912.1 hypothetical protein [Bacillus subtilis]ODV48181.1 hypothetical protein BCM26_04330 [Bacillus subtilis]OJH64138.1 hypothetical protein BOH71_07325 [Bacillus subtilis]